MKGQKFNGSWCRQGEQPPTIPKDEKSPMTMLTVYWDKNGPISIEFTRNPVKINSDVYCQQLENLHSRLKVLH